ncbi:SDR family NAD(P)-dependent oxidoreductase [Streptomyces eurythermus]|uniref:SDR family NAD(P)-dependent oxidoreductase n=1 Tax=Streptomyces eurythermus TaxID=42237 RepID=UPI00340397FC
MDWPDGAAAFVMGAASGIGLGIARALVAAGAKAAPADVDEGRLAEAAKELTDAGGTVVAVRLDVRDERSWATAADRVGEALGPVSLLCSVAGVNGGGPIEETPLEVWRWVLGVNTDGQFIGASTFPPRFKSRGTRSHILNTASVSGLVPMADVGACTASTFAGVGFTMVPREELGDSDVGVSPLIPGTVATRINFTAGEAEAKLLGRQLNREVAEADHAVLAAGADPDRVGEQVVEAVRDGRFVIVTHRERGDPVRRTHAETEDAYEAFDGRHGPDATARMLSGGTNPVTA